MMPNDMALFYIQTQDKLETLKFKDLPTEEKDQQQMFIIGFPGEIKDVKLHTPHFNQIQVKDDIPQLPNNCLVASEIKLKAQTGSKTKIAFTGSAGPGMSGGPLVYIKEGEVIACGVYNGTAAVPGHRLCALLLMTDSMTTKYLQYEIMIVRLFLQQCAKDTKFSRTFFYGHCESLDSFQSAYFLLNTKARQLIRDFDKNKNDHNLATRKGLFFEKLWKQIENPQDSEFQNKREVRFNLDNDINLDLAWSLEFDFDQIVQNFAAWHKLKQEEQNELVQNTVRTLKLDRNSMKKALVQTLKLDLDKWKQIQLQQVKALLLKSFQKKLQFIKQSQQVYKSEDEPEVQEIKDPGQGTTPAEPHLQSKPHKEEKSPKEHSLLQPRKFTETKPSGEEYECEKKEQRNKRNLQGDN